MKKLSVIELFAWVGWFRVWLENSEWKYKIVWSNQWEPSTKVQHASMVYEARFGNDNHSNENIENVQTKDIPDHDVLVWGFPCQDYSVAATLKNSKWLIWKKWVLWWSIHRILSEKKNKPKYLILENVDRLLKSPVSQRGRDFWVMLKSLNDLDYAVEWRVINAAEYGMPQRRRRVFIIWYHKTTEIYKKIKKTEKDKWISKKSIITEAFPIEKFNTNEWRHIEIKGSLEEISDSFAAPFENTGVSINGECFSIKTIPKYEGHKTNLGDILEKWKIDESYFIDVENLPKWEYLKWAKKETRITKDGYEYKYAEGGMIFPDALDNASRTIITWEGWTSASRFKHVVKTKKWLRRLTPIELERLNMFPDNHTKLEGVLDTKRAFFMWNALVTGVIQRIGSELYNQINK